ncbi:hypothetical protein JMJ35_001992 [Cladonia borealis]|uniref:Uncharacterized protein n=1 Tax=Cladonia borealis TaxID=184061 RepID=A0AA39R6X7_9LECA|nr:hypothetical protein JMJ35_001992 [Cladonia borealis]
MYQYIRLILCLTAIIAPNAAYAAKLSHKDPHSRPLGSARAPPTDTTASNIVQGLLTSNQGNIGKYIAEIPCNDINTLWTDAEAAKQFVQQLEEGQVPTLITNLPEEAVKEFSSVINILLTLPDEVINVAEAAVSDVVQIADDIEDGHITAVIASLPSDVVQIVTEGWDDLTNGLTDAWNGLTNGFDCVILNKCPKTTDTCGTPLTGAATTGATPTLTPILPPGVPSSAYAAPTGIYNQTGTGTQYGTQPSLASRSFEWALGSLLGIAVAGILGVAILL